MYLVSFLFAIQLCNFLSNDVELSNNYAIS